MKILYIDTSSSFLYTGIVDNHKLIAERKKEYGTKLSEEALPEIINMMEAQKVLPNDIDKIIVVNGPGSFTGIRIGITIAKVWAWGLDIPITTISALDAMRLSCDKKGLKIPIINARRGYVFGAIYEGDNVILKPSHIKLEELINKIGKNKDYTFITNDEFEEIENVEPYCANIERIVTTYEKKASKNPHSVNPEYLKLTEAEENNK